MDCYHGMDCYHDNNMIETVGVLKLLDSIWQDSDLLPMRTHLKPCFVYISRTQFHDGHRITDIGFLDGFEFPCILTS
jgi:hypothetical protein